MEEKQEKQTKWCEEITKKVEKQIEEIANEGVSNTNVDYLYRLIDIHKDLANEKYWKEKIDMYRENYGGNSYNEGSYGRRGVKGTGRGRYREGGNYNYGRGYGRYSGEEMMDEMYMNYGEYSEGRDNYGADQSTLQSLEKMLESVKKFMHHLQKEASSQEEVQMIKETAKEISMM